MYLSVTRSTRRACSKKKRRRVLTTTRTTRRERTVRNLLFVARNLLFAISASWRAWPASGLRAIRRRARARRRGCVVANDLDPSAIEAIKRNKAFNAAHGAGGGGADGQGHLSRPRRAHGDDAAREDVRRRRPGPVRHALNASGRRRAGGGRRRLAVRHRHGHGGAVRKQRRGVLDQVRVVPVAGEVLPRAGGESFAQRGGCRGGAVQKAHRPGVQRAHRLLRAMLCVRVYSSAKDAKLAPTKVSYAIPVRRVATRSSSSPWARRPRSTTR